MQYIDFGEVIRFHGHSCPGLAFGYRVAGAALRRLLTDRAIDEDLVAVVENSSCAVDAIQAVAGCTFGKGNLIFLDHGKQVYTFFRRLDGEGLRVAVSWKGPVESEADKAIWQRFFAGDRTPEVNDAVNKLKKEKTEAILRAAEEELLTFSRPQIEMSAPARIYDTVICTRCKEKVMITRTVGKGATAMCIPCAEKEEGRMINAKL